MKGLFIGMTTLDFQYLMEDYPPENTKIKSLQEDFSFGGPAANAAATFGFLGGEVNLLTKIGRNPLSSYIKHELSQYGIIATDFADKESATPVISSIITNVKTGNRTVIYPENKYPQSAVKPDKWSEDIQIICIDGFYPDIALPYLEMAKSKSIPVVMDAGSWKPGFEKMIAYVDVIICSSNFFPPGSSKIQDVFEFLTKKAISRIAVSRGEKPIWVNENGMSYQLKVEKPETVLDTLGAGDVLHGGFCHYFCKGNSFKKSLKEAASIASFSCGFLGAKNWMQKYKKQNNN